MGKLVQLAQEYERWKWARDCLLDQSCDYGFLERERAQKGRQAEEVAKKISEIREQIIKELNPWF